jgi:hypothetical protein
MSVRHLTWAFGLCFISGFVLGVARFWRQDAFDVDFDIEVVPMYWRQTDSAWEDVWEDFYDTLDSE